MKKINIKYFLFLIFAVNIFFIANFSETFANHNTLRYLSGKVIYKDDKSPVTDGMIKVFLINDISNTGSILGTTQIEMNGEFKILITPIQSEDGIKIMAYPNDYDNPESPFEPKVMKVENVFANNNEKTLTIEVNRIIDDVNKSQGSKKSDVKYEKISLLKQNFPNPFNPTTIIRFELPQTSNVTLKIYNMNGEAVATLVENKNLAKGMNEFEFNGNSLSSGIYIYSLTAGNYSETRKMTLLK